MTAEEKAAATIEAEASMKALARTLEQLRISIEQVGKWMLPDVKSVYGPLPPPKDVAHDALVVQLNVMALYRIRLWQHRFGG